MVERGGAGSRRSAWRHASSARLSLKRQVLQKLQQNPAKTPVDPVTERHRHSGLLAASAWRHKQEPVFTCSRNGGKQGRGGALHRHCNCGSDQQRAREGAEVPGEGPETLPDRKGAGWVQMAMRGCCIITIIIIIIPSSSIITTGSIIITCIPDELCSEACDSTPALCSSHLMHHYSSCMSKYCCPRQVLQMSCY